MGWDVGGTIRTVRHGAAVGNGNVFASSSRCLRARERKATVRIGGSSEENKEMVVEQQAYDHLLEVEQVPQATVVRFKRRTILEPTSIRAIGHRLLRLVGEEGRRTILVNFRGVESMTSAMLGEFAALQRALNDSGGQLAFCCVEPFLMQVFKVVKIPERIVIYADEETALQALSPAAP